MPVIIEDNVQIFPVSASGSTPLTIVPAPNAPTGNGANTQWVRIPAFILSSQNTGLATLSSGGTTISSFEFPGTWFLDYTLNGALAGQPTSSIVLTGFSGATIVGHMLAFYQNIIRSGVLGTPYGGLLLTLTKP